MNYLCERATGPAKTCDFRSGKVILQQPIERAQMEKLLNEGRTDVLRAFISNRTRRKFSAFLVRKPDGTVGFEFEPRAKTAAKTAASGRRAAAPETETKAPVRTGCEVHMPLGCRQRPSQPTQDNTHRSQTSGQGRCQASRQDTGTKGSEVSALTRDRHSRATAVAKYRPS